MSTAGKGWNVLMITTDGWRGDCLSFLGHPTVKTPNLDRLGREGVVFSSCYTQSTPCGPARASMWTGTYLMNHRSVSLGVPLRPGMTNLAWEARKLGFEPLLFGYTDIPSDPTDLSPSDPDLETINSGLKGLKVVLDQSADYRNYRFIAPWAAHLANKGYDLPSDLFELFRPRSGKAVPPGRGRTFHPPVFAAEDSETSFLTDSVIRYLRVVGKDRWFAHLSYVRPHPPVFATEPFNALYDPADVPEPIRARTIEDEQSVHPYLRYDLRRQEATPRLLSQYFVDPIPLSEASDLDQRQTRATYFGSLTEVDDSIGRLLKYLEDSQQLERTLIIFTSDHGDQLGDHWMLGKRGYFDETYHVPLIIRDPRVSDDGARGRRVDSFVEMVDIMPTVIEWIGGEVPRQCDGRSLLPFLHGVEPENWRKEAFWEYDFRDIRSAQPEVCLGLSVDECNLAVIRDNLFKYVHFAGLPALFFDLKEDPGQLRNLAKDPGYASLVLEYSQKLLSWRLRSQDRSRTGIELGPAGYIERR